VKVLLYYLFSYTTNTQWLCMLCHSYNVSYMQNIQVILIHTFHYNVITFPVHTGRKSPVLLMYSRSRDLVMLL